MSCPISPTATIGGTFHPTFNGIIVHHFYILFGRSTSDTACQIYLYAGNLRLRIGKTHHSRTGSRCQFHLNTIIIQHHRITVHFCHLTVMRVTGTVTAFGILFRTFERMQFSRGRHNQEITQIAIPTDAAHVGEAESFDGRMMPGIPGAVISSGLCIGTQLHQAERSAHTGKCFSQSVIGASHFIGGCSTDNRIDIICGRLLSPRIQYIQTDKQQIYNDKSFHKIIKLKDNKPFIIFAVWHSLQTPAFRHS